MNTESNIVLAIANNAGGSADMAHRIRPVHQLDRVALNLEPTPAIGPCSIAASHPTGGMRAPA